jgi:geranylgeranyl transferase type-2 subunit beta
MSELGYLERLTLQLTIGASLLSDKERQPHLRYILDSQRSDGGWAGREGESDLYYTSFAVRSLAILGALEGEVAQRAVNFLRGSLHTRQSIVDLLSLVYSGKLIDAACGLDAFADAKSNWGSELAALLQRLRRDDGGFAKSEDSRLSSTYQTFLASICLELIGEPMQDPDKAIQFILSQRQGDGGFLEVRVGKRSGTNPTAAAIGALRVLAALDDSVKQAAADFILSVQTNEGGFQANTRIPLPDLLSTFTGCVTLAELDSLGECDVQSARDYARQMQRPEGGFAGFELDPDRDIEYTFYGLGLLAMLNSEPS